MIDIVYFANLFVNRSHGHILIKEQLTDLIHTGLLDRGATLHIVLSTPYDYNHKMFKNTLSTLFHKQHKVQFYIQHDDCHEYPGISLAHHLALQDPSCSHFVLYFHSKSITRFRGKRECIEKSLHSTVIVPWKRVLDVFKIHPTIDKIGSTYSPLGWIWWNYWWSRASYLARVETPIKTPRRHYYEDWLSRCLYDPNIQNPPETEKNLHNSIYNISNKNCWSLSDPKGPACGAHEAVAKIKRKFI